MSESCLDALQMPNFVINGSVKEMSAMLDVFNGSIGLKIFNVDQPKPVFYRSLNPHVISAIESILNRLQKAPAESKDLIVMQKWIKDKKGYDNDYVMIFIKDSSMVYHLEIQYRDDEAKGGASHTHNFVFKSTNGLSIGSDKMSDADKSALAVQTFLKYLDKYVPMAVIMTKKKFVRDGNKPAPARQAESNDSYFG